MGLEKFSQRGKSIWGQFYIWKSKKNQEFPIQNEKQICSSHDEDYEYLIFLKRMHEYEQL